MHKTSDLVYRINLNLETVLSFAVGQPNVQRFLSSKLEYLYDPLKTIVSLEAERRADRALLAMASEMRLYDDQVGLSELLEGLGQKPLGEVVQAGGEVTDLHLRDMTNKVVHASGFRWELDDTEKPRVVCVSGEPERWQAATIWLSPLADLVNNLDG